MKRCLHITINETPGALPAGLQSKTPDAGTTDPGGNISMPPPDGGTDPSVGAHAGGYDGGYAKAGTAGATAATSASCQAAASVCCCSCACGCGGAASSAGGASPAPAPIPGVTAADYSGFVIVRLVEGLVSSSPAENLWTLAKTHAPELSELEAVLELPITKAAASPQAAAQVAPAPASVATTDSGGGATKAIPVRLPEPPPGTLPSRPLVEIAAPNRVECLAAIRRLETKFPASPFPPLHSLTAYWRVDLRKHPDLVEEVVQRLRSLAAVDLAYRELSANDPGAGSQAGQALSEDEGYLDDAPVGISARWAWPSLTPGKKVTVCDLEQGWNLVHQDLNLSLPVGPLLKDTSGQPVIVYGDNRSPTEGSTGDHGTAVLGQLAAAGQSGISVQGTAAGFVSLLPASHYRSVNSHIGSVPYAFAGTSGHVAAAIVQALAPNANPSLKAGDVLLLEVQRALLPTEVDEADLDAIRLASAQGVTVVEAAGNGGVDLDGLTVPETGRSLARTSSAFVDSGAILVGAARAALPHDRAYFSNYGSRVDCYGWGEAVTTCGYGDLAGTTATNFYTNVFDGTSSASPIIAGAAALVQALYNQALSGLQTSGTPGPWLTPSALRSLLSDPATGTPQGPNVAGSIGVMPNLRAVLGSGAGLVPVPYMRRHVGDDGSRPAPGDEISSSPDILVWKGGGTAAVARFGEGLRANTPAPGTLIDPAHPEQIYPSDVYVRLRNRGGGTGKARVHLFASPAATLITPERWLPLGAVDVPSIAPGDLLTVSPPLGPSLTQPLPPDTLSLTTLWQGTAPWPASFAPLWPGSVVPPYSLLAVQTPDAVQGLPSALASPSVLPPGPPYFDWAETRAFLRGPGVAWRNSYPITTAPALTLAFLIAGTPDQARFFDFEILQRLPAGATVTLAVPDPLAAKLRQRQPALGSDQSLSVPRQPRTQIHRLQLAAGTAAPAAFAITTGTSPLATGHSLAIRQLWKGEEVGRITWWFITQNDPEAD